MPLHIEDHGSANWIEVAPADRDALEGRIVFTGTGAQVAIGPGCVATSLRIEAGTGATVRICAGCHLGALFIHVSPAAHVELGANAGLNGAVRVLLHEPGRVVIGPGALIADGVDILNSDMHPILDRRTGARLNPAVDVDIGPRVWIGQRSMVLKGAHIGHDTIIGAGSVVTGSIPAHCIAAGNPARVVRTGVRWDWTLPEPIADSV